MNFASAQSVFAGVICIEDLNDHKVEDLEKWEEALRLGHILIFRSAVSFRELRRITNGILSAETPAVEDTRVIQGVGNIHYVASHEARDDTYSCRDLSYYFFPWNRDTSGLFDLVQPVFSVVARLNGYEPEDLLEQQPKDGVVQRFHLICYPDGSGHISTHLDPVKVTKYTSGVYVTQYGQDYVDGGFYIIDGNGEKIVIDSMVESGDMVVFPAHFAHGVDTVKCGYPSGVTDLSFRGRIFLNMTVIESHEVSDRAYTQAFRP